jgi:hypothetical protein
LRKWSGLAHVCTITRCYKSQGLNAAACLLSECRPVTLPGS